MFSHLLFTIQGSFNKFFFRHLYHYILEFFFNLFENDNPEDNPEEESTNQLMRRSQIYTCPDWFEIQLV